MAPTALDQEAQTSRIVLGGPFPTDQQILEVLEIHLESHLVDPEYT